jgi:Ca2+:H+ antiporter
MRRLLAPENLLNLPLLFVPVALLLKHGVEARADYVFAASALAIGPLAGLMGKAAEHLAVRLGEGLGGLLNASFGTAAELIIALMALNAGLHDLVRASITGSIMGNVPLVLGLSLLAGGMRYRIQTFNRTASNLAATMRVLSSIALVVRGVLHVLARGGTSRETELRREISVVLFVT